MTSAASLMSGQTPLAVRMRPTSLDEVAGQQHLLRPGSPIVALADPEASAPGAVSIILWGPPGTGKTTLAQAIARSSGRRFVELSAITAGVKDVREVMQEAITQRDLYGQTTILFLDEIHRFTKAQQDALLPGVENGWVILIAATTENPSFSVISPLLSRSLLLTLQPLTDDDIGVLVDRAVTDARGLAGRVRLTDEARAALIRLASGDGRRALTGLEAAAAVALSRADADASADVTDEDVSQAVDRALLRYDRQGDEHYDVISAFIKSIRGSDADAAVHYLARMIEAGEDPRFIARRLVISAAEDIGLADPQALVIATAAADAVAFIGMPEGRIPLAEATIYLATTAKSNAAYLAINQAIADVRAGGFGRVPIHLRDAHYAGAKRLGHGKGYRYPHDNEAGIVPQQYLPDDLDGRRYYQPKPLGAERDVAARLERIRRILGDR
ncbi:replication-associated recombination protein A [Microbacterium esteraromaticum]|uniref:Replication-associated recombination protein A n=1 Tax=Microbacterium esteraromaticum TaxID=57043 RepID=A0A939IVJ9_9MICO|nr:replication-associated recombination protein A [Microbacterium esteraromaticum]MBN7792564.1 replication-associated recombination protein A [Microbacterium esteraromaticum]MBN8206169.1 replication-associated recombination protein A [Microbacterium esteraromaticum]MBN8416324.1 replication-associated recombination protein A [Microbacterium esteraromaticum]MBN8423321.1 replication-associated recombination protein A [Microbacterium esteraromaticum]MCA1306327.1 replication-associated recombinatio